MAAFYLWDHLDWAAVLFQFCAYTFDEGPRSGRAREGVPGADVAGHGMVPVVGAGDGAGGHALLFHAAGNGCAQCGESGAGVALVWLVGAGVDGGIRGDLFLAASREGYTRFGVGARDWDQRDRDCG